MKTLPILAAVAALATLSACDEGYGGTEIGWGPAGYAYDGWYDGYYGPIYDGYWGDDGGFWYRSRSVDRHWRRGDGAHFRREQPMPGVNMPHNDARTFQHFNGSIQTRPQGRMPHFPRGPR
ncbi:MAG: hypothetical protein KGM17_13000 [Sphingomonadales bacterium]|nr:hypothetical protein [Sphingomonadales bacterium]